MKIEHLNKAPLSREEILHLEGLRATVEKALGDGRLSADEHEYIQSLIWADGKVTYEELRTINETTYNLTGNSLPELEWRRAD